MSVSKMSSRGTVCRGNVSSEISLFGKLSFGELSIGEMFVMKLSGYHANAIVWLIFLM